MLRSVLLHAVSSSLLLACPTVAQAPQPERSRGAILVELFTSEGCSDCPPADALLRAISGTHLEEGPNIIVLSEHVTYWNDLGWKDVFSSPLFTERQNGYGRKFFLDSVYTPQMVVDGTQQFVGGNRTALLEALHAQAKRPHIDLRITSLQLAADALTVQFSAGNVTANTPLDIRAAVTDDLDQTHVLRGENGGHTLTHVAVARSLQRIAEVRGNGAQTVRIPLASTAFLADGPHHLTLFAQQHDLGAVLGADTQPLVSSHQP